MQSIPGIGPVCAEAILSETGGVARFERVGKVGAFMRLSPVERCSCTLVRGKAHISKKGNNRLRHLLYIPAMTARRYNPQVAALAQCLKAKGKPAKAIICTCIRKLVQVPTACSSMASL